MAEPILKWAGGKRQILDAVRSCFPPESECNRYHEPFFGGGALFFREAPHPPGSTINDINKRLMNFYRQVQNNPDELIEILNSFRSPDAPPDESREYSDERRNKNYDLETYYHQQRELFNRRPNSEEFDPLEEAAFLLYLNRTCYNGLYRENSNGEFNVPAGDYKNPDWVQAKRIKQASELLNGVKIFEEDFGYITDEAEENDLIYFDPPYKPVEKSSSFVEYHGSGFGEEEQDRLREVAVELDEIGVHIAISNSPPVWSKYEYLDEFYIQSVDARRNINSVAEDRDGVQEIIITNVPKDNRRMYAPELGDFDVPESAEPQ